jgi:predicted amidohydrolase
MKISIAQTRPVKGDIAANLELHQNIIQLSASLGASAVFFPELSLTGYEPTIARQLATTLADTRFDCLQMASDTRRITIGVGVPTAVSAGILISMVLFQPFQPPQIYSKQQLHPDEFPFFVEGEGQLIIIMEDKKIAPAICYESLQPAHAERAHTLGAALYIASVAKSTAGINRAMDHFPAVALKHSMAVLMSNSVGFCDNFYSAGRSAVWTRQGMLAGQLDDQHEGLLTFDTETEEVHTQML